jgi:hypothetical protein
MWMPNVISMDLVIFHFQMKYRIDSWIYFFKTEEFGAEFDCPCPLAVIRAQKISKMFLFVFLCYTESSAPFYLISAATRWKMREEISSGWQIYRRKRFGAGERHMAFGFFLSARYTGENQSLCEELSVRSLNE